MRRIKEFFWELFHVFFRYYNFPTKLGLRRVGNPDESSPVFLSGNYTLTVKRVLRNLAGLDCYLLVANSRGSNVWCAAGMNEFSEFDVIDAINVTGLKDLVRHRRLIAPPYAAPGVLARAVKDETGFNIRWGPTHLDDLPRYIANGLRRTEDMAKVQFGLQDRIELALATSLAYAMTIGIGLFFWPRFFAGVIGLIFVVFLFAFGFYPLFPEERHWRRVLLQAAILTAGLSAFGVWQGWTRPQFLLWEGVLLAVTLLMALDSCGATAIQKTSLWHWLTTGNYRSLFSPVVDPALCANCGQCLLVCPRGVFGLRRGVKKMVAIHPDACEECLACVRQCDSDAIFNRSGEYKHDVKCVPNLDYLVTRDWSHLRDEDRWIDWPTRLRHGLPVVVEEADRSVPEKRAVAC